jgi:hypothetical protein
VQSTPNKPEFEGMLSEQYGEFFCGFVANVN